MAHIVIVGSGIAGLICCRETRRCKPQRYGDYQTEDKGFIHQLGPRGESLQSLTRPTTMGWRPTSKTRFALAMDCAMKQVVRSIIQEAGERISDLIDIGVTF